MARDESKKTARGANDNELKFSQSTPRRSVSSGARTSERVQGGERQRAAQASRKRKMPPVIKYSRVAKLIFAALLVIFGITAVVYALNAKPTEKQAEAALTEYIDNGTFFDGITVNGVDVSGLTYAQAREKVLPSVESIVKSIGITLKHNSSLWLLSSADLGISTTLDSALTEAIMLGRGDTVIENNKAKDMLKTSGRDFSISYTADEAMLRTVLSEIGVHVDTDAVEPYVTPDSWATEPSFHYYEGSDGYILDESKLYDEICAALAAGQFSSTLEVALDLTPPEHDMNWLKANTQLRGTYYTEYKRSSQHTTERKGNITKASGLLNGAIVENGATFSFNEFIGPRTEEGGWPLAPGIVNGNSYELQAGGGICQVSTTLYNALLCCGPEVEITVRKHHSWPSSYVPYGLDATVSTGGPDLCFINNTGAPLYIFSNANNTDYVMTISIYGAPLPDGITYVTRAETTETLPKPEATREANPKWPTGFEAETIKGREGYRATAYRDTLDKDGNVIATEKLYDDTYKAVTPVITYGTGDPSLPKPEL